MSSYPNPYTLNPSAMDRGFIALISVIVIGFVLLVAVIALGNRSITGRFLLLTFEHKAASEALAEACVQTAIIAVVNNSLYSTSEKGVDVGSGLCVIHSVAPFGIDESMIKTTASSSDATTNLEVVVKTGDGSIVSWKEIPSF